MAKVHIASAGAPLSDGLLQLQNGDAMDATLRPVTDQSNTASPLELSTGLVSVSSTLQIATNDVQYIDAEDTGGNNRFTVSRAVGSQTVNVDFASNPTLGTDQVGAIRTYQDGVSLSDAIGFQKNGQVTFTERVKIEADSTSTTQSAAVIQSTTTNAGLVLQPNGTGAIMAQVPDGTATGGRARGDNAVDLQMVRSSVDQVSRSSFTVIAGGANNQIGSNSNYAIVCGGQANVANNIWASILGGQGNTASSQYSTISGGQSNTASTNTHATVVGGSTNTASGQYSVAGGYNNVASAQGAVALGYNNTATGQKNISIGYNNTGGGAYSVAIGSGNQSTVSVGNFYGAMVGYNNVLSGGGRSFVFGEGNNISSAGVRNVAIGYASSVTDGSSNMAINSGRARGSYSLGKGLYGDAYLYNAESRGFGGDYLGTPRLGEETVCVAGKTDILASAATTVLSLDGTGTHLIIPDGTNRAWNVTVKWVAVITADGGAAGITVGDTIASTEQLLFKKVAGVSSVVGTASTISTHSDASMASCSMAYTAGASQELALTFTGPTFAAGGPVTCRIIAKVELTEVVW